MDSEETNIISGYFGISSENQSNEVIPKILLTLILKCWGKIKTQSHPRSSFMTSSEHICIKICCIILKYCHVKLIV